MHLTSFSAPRHSSCIVLAAVLGLGEATHGNIATRSYADRPGLRKVRVARSKSQAIDTRPHRKPGSLATWTQPPQHLGGNTARRVLEVCGAAKARRRKAGLIHTEGQQFFPAAGRRKAQRSRLARRQRAARTRAPRATRSGCTSVAD